MISKELKKIINLVKRTGDRVVIYDTQESEETFVLMDFDSYEKLINKELKNKEDEVVVESKKKLKLEEKNDNLLAKSTTESPVIKDLTEEDLTDKINREISLWKNQENLSFVAGDQKVEKSVKPWSISSQVKEKAKEVE